TSAPKAKLTVDATSTRRKEDDVPSSRPRRRSDRPRVRPPGRDPSSSPAGADRRKLVRLEIVLINAVKCVRFQGRDADAVIDHQVHQLAAVNEHNLLADSLDVIASIMAESRGRNHDAPASVHTVKTSRESLDDGPPD